MLAGSREARKRQKQSGQERMQRRLAEEERAENEEHLRSISETPEPAAEETNSTNISDLQDSDAATIHSGNDSLDAGESRIHFFDLPQEVRDMIYARFPGLASIHINQDPCKGALQPPLSQVSTRMRQECLDVFYGRNNFFLDLRGWKSTVFPKKWTPGTIFERWITTIGEENVARLRSLKFYSHNFSVNVRLSNESPPTLTMKFRTFISKAEVGEGVSSSYDFATAARRAEYGLRRLLNWIQKKTKKRGLSIHDLKTIFWAVDMAQPFLCRRISLGYQGAVLRHDDVPVSQWPSVADHLDKCDDW